MIEEEKKHAKYAPSTGKRWTNCSKCIQLCENLPESETSIYAATGTVQHAVAELLLQDRKKGRNKIASAYDYVGEVFEEADFEIKITENMADAIDGYLDLIAQDLAKLGLAYNNLDIEKQVRLDGVSADCYGTADAIIHQDFGKLTIYDEKYGQNIVEAKDNTQLIIYLIGASILYPDCDTFEVVIYQPYAKRPSGPIGRWAVCKDDLLLYRERLRMAIKECESDDAKFVTGPWCKWCPGATEQVCTALADDIYKTVIDDFSNAPAVLTAANPAKIVSALEKVPMIMQWCTAVKEYANRIAENGDLPGYKMVEKYGNRKWKNEDAALDALSQMYGADAYNKKLKSPAQAEKLFGKGKKGKYEFNLEMGSYVEIPMTGKTLVKCDDIRLAVKDSVKEDFKAIPKLVKELDI